ncbi:telomerase reverse transcriptase isoform X1 [Pogona vitticeps]
MGRPRRWRAVQGLLRSCYAEVLPLEAFVERLQGQAQAEGPLVPLVQEGDPACYRHLVERCLVGRAPGCKALPSRVVFQQVSSLNDVVARVIQRICEKKKKNLLASGYSLLNENNYQLSCMPNIYTYLPNNTTETIRQSVLWEIILSRVGDDVMMYLLEHCALFMLVPPSCCYQMCGQPIYELALRNATLSSAFFRQRYPGPTRSALSGYLQKRLKSCGKFLATANRKKGNSRSQKSRKIQKGLECDCRLSPMGYEVHGLKPAKSKPFAGMSICRESVQRSDQCTSLTAPLLKRKWTGQCGTSAKRVKIMQTEEELEKETRNLVPTKSKNIVMLDDGGDASTSKRCARLCTEDGLIVVKSVPQSPECGAQMSNVPYAVPDNQESFLCDKILTLDNESETLCELNSRRESRTRQPKLRTGDSDVCFGQPLGTEMTSGGRGCKTRVSKSVRNSDRSSVPVTYIERRFLLYCHRQLKERLPESFILNRLKSFSSGGRWLVEVIFLDSKITKQPDSINPRSSGKRKRRIPKRYREMRGLFQELLENHSKCPYLKVLRKNCPVWVSESVQKSTEGESDKEKDHRKGRSSSGSHQDTTLENCFRLAPDGLNPFPGTSEDSIRKSENAELKRKNTEGQISPDSSSSGIMTFLKQHSTHWQVYMFVRECIERVVPAALWGSSHNKCRFYKNVKKFISLGKFNVFSLRELMWKMRVKNCVWLRLNKEQGHFVPSSEHRFRQDLMAKFLYWLMDSYVAELLRSFFYITETMFQKNLLFFFRKSIWSKLESIGIRNHLAKVHLRVLLKEEIKTLQQQKCVPLASKLRFIPKPNGLRPVVKQNGVVGAETFSRKAGEKKIQYFNTQLKNLFSVLNYERIKNPMLLGSSVFGKDDIYAVWKKFVLKVLKLNAVLPRFYFVKADVIGAYDSIPHNKLVEVILQALSLDEKTTYSIRRYAVIIRTRNGLIRRYYRRHVSTYKEFIPDMKEFINHLQEVTSLRNAVVVEQSVSLKESNTSLAEFFLKFIQNSILKIKDRYYVQRCGIPQGSILSTLLCNFCYGDMENKLLQGVQKDGVLMRLTDDFLLVTPHLTQAKMFLRTLAMGVPEYGFVINPAKTVVNFPIDEDIPGCSEFKQLPAHGVIPWCGLLIDTQTLEVYCDYSSYACTSIRSSLSFNSSTKAGVRLRNKLLAVLQLKCHSLFVDLQINSLRTVCINICKILLLQAYRFHACVLQLPFNQKIKSNRRFFLKIISDTASCCFSVLKTKNKDVSFTSTGTSVVLTYEVVQWLTYHAFVIKLTHHKVIYKCLLAPLKHCKKRLLRQIPETTVQFLKEVTEPSLYEDFKAILD